MNAVSLLESRETGFICAENEAVKKWKGKNGEVWSLIWHSLRFLSLRLSLIQSTPVWYLTSPPAVWNDTSQRITQKTRLEEEEKRGCSQLPSCLTAPWQIHQDSQTLHKIPLTKPWDSRHLALTARRLSLQWELATGWEKAFIFNPKEGTFTVSQLRILL